MTKSREFAPITEADDALILQLKPEHQKILTMKGSMAVIAEQLGWNIGTAKSRLHRARNALDALRNPPAGK